MDFRLWLERKFLQIPYETEQAVNALVSNIHKGFNQSAVIPLGDRQIPVSFARLPTNLAAQYTPRPEKILINTEALRNQEMLDSLAASILHEIVHAIDPKTKQQKFVNSYKKLSGVDDPNYFRHPAEFDAFGSGVEIEIKKAFDDKQVAAQERMKVLQGLKAWLRTGRVSPDIQGWLDTPLFNAWKASPILWKQFRQKLYTTLVGVEQNLNKEIANGRTT